MKRRIADALNRILAILGIACIILAQACFVMPDLSHAEEAGAVLVVRVQYYGEWGDKIREKASFTRAELESMGSSTYYYSNVTRVGTVMSMAASGPSVMTIIEKAGIDPASIKNITFRTTDGYTRNFSVAGHMTATKYYYPKLSSCYERNEAGNAITPTEGALEGMTTVPAILATKYGESKLPSTRAESLSMSTNKTYRFCLGQSLLTVGRMTNPKDEGGDVSSMDSCHSIYGIDVTLSGSPIKGIGLSIEGKEIKVGSQKRVAAKLELDDAFEGDFSAKDLSWKSSDTSIATVDENGNVTVKKRGAFTITVTAPDGTTASITINDPNSDKSSKTDDKTSKEKSSTIKKKEAKKLTVVQITAKEVQLGDVIEETAVHDDNRQKMAADATALDEARNYSRGVAAGTAAGAGLLCGIGALIRVIKYKKLF